MSKYKLRKPQIISNTLSEYLNWMFITDDNLLITKNTLVMAFFEIECNGDYYSPVNDESVAAMWNRMIMQMPDDISLWFEVQKYKSSEEQYPTDANFIQPADKDLEKLRLLQFNSLNPVFLSKRILSIAFSPSVSRNGISEDSVDTFRKLIIDLIGRFQSVGIIAKQMDKKQICNYLHTCISDKKYEIEVPSAHTHSLSDALWDVDIDSTLIPMKLGNKFISVISIDDLPVTGTTAEMLSSIISIDGSIRWVTRYICKSSDSAKKIIDTKRRQFLSRRFSARDIAANAMFDSNIELMDTGELSNYQECELALEDNGIEVNFGYYTGLFVLEASTEDEIKKMSLFIQNKLAKKGFIYKEEGLNLFASWISSLPGSIEANARSQFISSGNLSCMLSLTAPYAGLKENLHLKQISGCGLPNAIGLLPNKSLYYFNFNGSSDVGHTFILGPTGSGKSLLLSFFCASWGKYPGSRVIFFDKGGSFKHYAASNNAAIYHPGYDLTTFQPLRDSANNIERCMRFLTAIAAVQNIHLQASDKQKMAEALRLMVPEHENLTIYKKLLEGADHSNEMVSALENYILGGTWGELFDSEKDTLDPTSWPMTTMIEMGTLMEMGDEAIIPALTYIFAQLDELFEDKKPTLLVLDEAWIYLKHPTFKGFIENWLKTLRKYNVFVVLATQEVSDFSELIKSVLTNCHTKIMLPNNNAETGPMADLYAEIGLTDTELALLSKNMITKRDYYIIQPEGNAIVNFDINNQQLNILRRN